MRRTALAAGGFFLLSLIIYNLNLRGIPSLDTRGARLIPIALLSDGTLHLDRLEPLFPTGPLTDYWYTRSASGHIVSGYPIVVPLLVTPFFISAAHSFENGMDAELFTRQLEFTEKLSASVVAALSVAVVWLLLRQLTAERYAAWLTIAYAFGTETWSVSSQALWQHGTSELLLAAMLLALLQRSTVAHQLAGLMGGLLAFNRPPNALFVAAAIVYLALFNRRLLPAFLAPCALVAALGLAYNVSEFSTVFGGYRSHMHADYYTFSFSAWLDGTAGVLLSPGRGLLPFAPFFLFLLGLPRVTVRTPLRRMLACFLPAAAVQAAFYGSFAGWTGGVSYGPRMLTDLTPILILGLVPVVEGLRGRLLPAVFALAIAFSIAVQAIGAFCFPMGGSARDTDMWNFTRLQYVVELRGGVAPIEFRWAIKPPNVLW